MKNPKLYVSILILILCLLNIRTVFAGDPPSSTNVTTPPSSVDVTTKSQIIPSLQNPLQTKDVKTLLGTIVDFAIFIGLILAVLVFIFIGFKFVMAQGSDSALKEAKTWFLYAVIGTAVLISAKVIVDVVTNTFISAGIVNENLLKKP